MTFERPTDSRSKNGTDDVEEVDDSQTDWGDLSQSLFLLYLSEDGLIAGEGGEVEEDEEAEFEGLYLCGHDVVKSKIGIGFGGNQTWMESEIEIEM